MCPSYASKNQAATHNREHQRSADVITNTTAAAAEPNTTPETPEQRDKRLLKQARRERLDVQWSSTGEALVLSYSRRPTRHIVRFNHTEHQVGACPCESLMRCKHQVIAEWSALRKLIAEARTRRAEGSLEAQLEASLEVAGDRKLMEQKRLERERDNGIVPVRQFNRAALFGETS